MLRNIVKACNLFRFSNEVAKTAAKPTTATSGLTYYKDGQLVNRTSITLKKQEDIESYVIKTVQNYFRTTYKQGTRFIIKVWVGPVPLPIMDWTLSTRLRLQCRWSKIWATRFQHKLYLPSRALSTISLTLSKWKHLSARTTKILFHDCASQMNTYLIFKGMSQQNT